MISLRTANTIIRNYTKALKSEVVSFFNSSQRTLSQDVYATGDLPPFDRATVDGFAVRSQDIKDALKENPISLKVVAVVQAGIPSKKALKSGQAIKIMTGGVVPNGADCVVMKESAILKGPSVGILKAVKRNEGIAFRGHDIKRGQVLIKKGTYISPALVALLASSGIAKIKVYKRPRVAILVTGNELRQIREKLTPGTIRSSNQYGLSCQVKEAGGEPVILGIARDNLTETRKKISQGLKSDMLIISGGVSVGDFDLVPQVLRDLKTTIFIEKVAMQPGKPLIFGRKGKTTIFGLPGNPVSTMVCFYEFVRPCLMLMQGRKSFDLPMAEVVLGEEIRLKAERTKILRGTTFMRGGKIFVRRSAHQGSGNIISLAKADCLFKIPAGITHVNKGTKVKIVYLPFK